MKRVAAYSRRVVGVVTGAALVLLAGALPVAATTSGTALVISQV